jgi:DNA-binding transcriptional LysR family regulator
MDPMDLQQLRYFITIVESGSLSKAAEALNMTQPPLSIMISKLEKELNVSLFDRSGKRMKLTQHGELLYRRGKELLAAAENIQKELLEHRDGIRGTVHAGCITSANLFILPQVVQRIRNETPHVTVRVKEGNSAFILNELRNHALDLGIVRTIFEADDLHITTLLEEPLLLAVPPGHHLLEKPLIDLKDLQNEKFLLPTTSYGRGIADEIIESCQSLGFAPDVVYWGTEMLPMLMMVQKGVGISFVPQLFSKLQWPGMPKLLSLEHPKLVTKLSLVTLRTHYLHTAAKHFIHMTEEGIRQLKHDLAQSQV